MLSSVDKADGREGDNIKNEMKTILELSNLEAKSFFLKQKAYCSIDLPQYFDFQPLLDKLVIAIGDNELRKSIRKTQKKSKMLITNSILIKTDVLIGDLYN